MYRQPQQPANCDQLHAVFHDRHFTGRSFTQFWCPIVGGELLKKDGSKSLFLGLAQDGNSGIPYLVAKKPNEYKGLETPSLRKFNYTVLKFTFKTVDLCNCLEFLST